jgi:nitrous oxidase accessory protein NosD
MTGGTHFAKASPLPCLTRRRFAGTAAAALASAAGVTFATRRAQAAEFAYKYASNIVVDHPMNLRARGGGALQAGAERPARDPNPNAAR